MVLGASFALQLIGESVAVAGIVGASAAILFGRQPPFFGIDPRARGLWYIVEP